MIERVVKTISRYSMFVPGQSVGVAVSGGADSVCLLYVLREIGLPLRVVHLNHLLRGAESDADEAFVRELANELGLPAHIERADVARFPGNLEQAARRARREFFLQLIREGAVHRVATGHTRSDQAETVLFRFLRGAGPTGLSAIRPLTSDGIARPLIEVDRAEIEGYLRARGIPWRTDSTNSDPAFARNRIRHELLPALTREWNPKLPETLTRTAQIVLEEEPYWQCEADRHVKLRDGAVVFETAHLKALVPALRRRVIRRAIEVSKGDLRGIAFAHIEAVAALADSRSGHARLQIPGLDVVRSFDRIRLAPPAKYGAAPKYGDSHLNPQFPGVYVLGSHEIRFELCPAAAAIRPEPAPGPVDYAVVFAAPASATELRSTDEPAGVPAAPRPEVASAGEVSCGPDTPGAPRREPVAVAGDSGAPAPEPAPAAKAPGAAGALVSPLRSGYNEEYRTAHRHVLDWERISGGTLVLRNWRPGDRYLPTGHASEIKIKHLFQQARIPVWQRRAWPVLARGDEILWVSRFGPASHFAATAASRRLLRIVETITE